jgi:large subunit ribosomal protein L15
MELADITKLGGRNKARKRVGRGQASGSGKTSGRGNKGSGQRAGGGTRQLTEGGQMPFFRRLPKRGFSNVRFRAHYDVVNVSALERFFDAGSEVTKQAMHEFGLIPSVRCLVKILGDGSLSKKLTVQADKFSKSAREKIAAAGGAANEVGVGA